MVYPREAMRAPHMPPPQVWNQRGVPVEDVREHRCATMEQNRRQYVHSELNCPHSAGRKKQNPFSPDDGPERTRRARVFCAGHVAAPLGPLLAILPPLGGHMTMPVHALDPKGTRDRREARHGFRPWSGQQQEDWSTPRYMRQLPHREHATVHAHEISKGRW